MAIVGRTSVDSRCASGVLPLATPWCLSIIAADVPARAVPTVAVPAVPSAAPPVALSVNPAGMVMEEVAVMPAAMVTTAVMTAAVTATMVTATMVTATVTAATVTALRLRRRISRGHRQTGYADDCETIDAKQGACCRQGHQEFAYSTLSILPDHFISDLARLTLAPQIGPLRPDAAIAI